MITLPWIEKYRPKDFESYIFHDQAMKKKFQSFVANGSIPNLLISGVQGTGKTTISKILIDLLHIDPADVLVITRWPSSLAMKASNCWASLGCLLDFSAAAEDTVIRPPASPSVK